MHNDIVISARGLGRDYRRILKAEGLRSAVKNLFAPNAATVSALGGFDLTVRRGEFLGLIGPNGAGKTTLVKLLSGLLEPSSGELSVLGFRPADRKQAFLSRISLVMGQKSRLWWDLPALDSFALNKAVYNIPEDRFRRTLTRLSRDLEAEDLLRSPVRTLSLGERMRVELMDALLHEPELLFLDEPTIGLDAPAQKRMREFLRKEHRDRGITLILTSHYMEDIRRLCPRCVLIQGGRLRYDGPTESMLDSVRERKILKVRLVSGQDLESAPPGCPGEFRRLEQGSFALLLKPADLGAAVQSVLDHYEPADLAIEEEPIEDIVEKLYADRPAEAPYGR